MNGFEPSARTRSIIMPPIAGIMNRVRELRNLGTDIVSMAQAVPWYTPPDRVLSRFSEKLREARLHGYGPDPGFPGTRKLVAEDFAARRNIRLDPEKELHLTCGASQAFLSALLAVTSAGDRVCLVEPYYFDHLFAVIFSDLEPVIVPMLEKDGGWIFPMDRLEQVIEDINVLVVVNPGNPTGHVIPDKTMAELSRLTMKHGVFLLLDETYERFVFTGDGCHPWSAERLPNILTFGSFSKSLGMAGWRLGYLFGGEKILEQALKVQDSVVICPPSPAQVLLELAIGEKEWTETMSASIRLRMHACEQALDHNPHFHWRKVGGGFFTLAAYDGGATSERVALHLLEEHGIGTIPGSAFGDAGEGHVRISFGCLPPGEVDAAMERVSHMTLPRVQ